MLTSDLIDRLTGGGVPPADRPVFTPHPSFAGVDLARLIGAADSDGRLATLVVTLAPGARMAPHRHDHQTEQHLVLAGSGRMLDAGEERSYAPGSLHLIGEGREHSVIAGDDGMVLMAVFTPAV